MVKLRGTSEIRTPRLVLRRFRLEDAQDMFDNYCSDGDVTKFLMWDTHKTVDTTLGYVKSRLSNYENGDFFDWAIEYEGNVIGTVSVVDMSVVDMCATLGYCMGKKWWGIGIMTEAARAVCEYLIKEAGFHRVCAYHDVENPASGRVMQKIGMKYEGTLREARFVKGRFVSMKYYSVLENELV